MPKFCDFEKWAGTNITCHGSTICEEYLGTAKIHTIKHTFAVGMEQSGASISTIGNRFGHSNYKVTADCLKRLHDNENLTGIRWRIALGYKTDMLRRNTTSSHMHTHA